MEAWGDVVTVDVIVAGILVVVIVSVICFAAYMIKAESFEFTTVFLKAVSFSIKIVSPDHRDQRRPRR